MIAVQQRLLVAAFSAAVCLAFPAGSSAGQEPARVPPAPAAAAPQPALPQTAPAQTTAPQTAAPQPPPPAVAGGIQVPADYVIGTEDSLGIVFWREKDMSADVVVRPDGKISLPLLNDVEVDGLTPDQVRVRVTDLAKKYIEDPTVTVVVKQINSRKIFITGNVERPGTFPLLRPTTVLQLIALAGGLKEFANAGDIVLVRTEGTKQETFSFNYDQLKNRKNLAQNIFLRPGDTIIVP